MIKKKSEQGLPGDGHCLEEAGGNFLGVELLCLDRSVGYTGACVCQNSSNYTLFHCMLFPSLGFLCSLAVNLGRVALPTPTRPLSGMGNEGGSHRWTTGRRGAAVSCPLGF